MLFAAVENCSEASTDSAEIFTVRFRMKVEIALSNHSLLVSRINSVSARLKNKLS